MATKTPAEVPGSASRSAGTGDDPMTSRRYGGATSSAAWVVEQHPGDVMQVTCRAHGVVCCAKCREYALDTDFHYYEPCGDRYLAAHSCDLAAGHDGDHASPSPDLHTVTTWPRDLVAGGQGRDAEDVREDATFVGSLGLLCVGFVVGFFAALAVIS